MSDKDSAEIALDDALIEGGNEHAKSITGGPSAETIAHCKGKKPMCIHTDKDFELMCNPDKFCYGEGGFNTERLTHTVFQPTFVEC